MQYSFLEEVYGCRINTIKLRRHAMSSRRDSEGLSAPGTVAAEPFVHLYTASLLNLVTRVRSIGELQAAKAVGCSVEELQEAFSHLAAIKAVKRARKPGGRVEYRVTDAGRHLRENVLTELDATVQLMWPPDAIRIESEARREQAKKLIEFADLLHYGPAG